MIPELLYRFDRSLREGKRLVVLTDSVLGQACGLFVHSYDGDPSPDSVAQLFDLSFSILLHHGDDVHHLVSLPVVQYLGRYKVTLVNRSIAGQVTITNGQPFSVDAHLGLE